MAWLLKPHSALRGVMIMKQIIVLAMLALAAVGTTIMMTIHPQTCRQLQGGMSIAEGPAPKGQPQPVNYPHVVYHCGNVSDGAIPLASTAGSRWTAARPGHSS